MSHRFATRARKPNAGGDRPVAVARGWRFAWVVEFVGGQLGAFGPVFIILSVIAVVKVRSMSQLSPQERSDRLWLALSALPAVGFFLVLSVTKPVLGNWPIPSFAPVVPLVAELLMREWIVACESMAPAAQREYRRVRSLWTTVAVYGLVGWGLIAFPNLISHLPIVGAAFESEIASRFQGHRAEAHRLATVLRNAETPQDATPIIITRYYMTAALYAFYLPDHPRVFSAGSLVGKHATSYDFWPDTDLRSPDLHGRTAILHGEPSIPWDQVLSFGDIERIADGRYSIARNFRGLQTRESDQYSNSGR